MDIQRYANRAAAYKRDVAGRYMAVDRDGITAKIHEAEQYVVSVKVDGHFYVLCYENGEAKFINPKGRTVEGVAAATEVAALLKKAGIEQAIIPGELYLPQGDKRTRSFDVGKALTDAPNAVAFAAFDMLEKNDAALETTNIADIHAELKGIFSGDQVTAVDTELVESRKQIDDIYDRVVEQNGEEGLVVKPVNSRFAYKVKPKYTLDGVIVGYAEGSGDPNAPTSSGQTRIGAGMLRDFLIALRQEDGSYQLICHLAHGFSDADRVSLLDKFSKKVVKTEYIEVARNKVAFQMVEPDTVVEFTCLDVISEDASGAIFKMNLEYDESEGYRIKARQPAVSITIPVFQRFRDDKDANPQDVRFKQAEDICEVSTDAAELAELEPSDVLQREVFVKEAKGKKMVRKFMKWRTNKKGDNYPAYVFFYTDFSPNRKDPLKREIRVSNSEEQIDALYAESLAANIKKGWDAA